MLRLKVCHIFCALGLVVFGLYYVWLDPLWKLAGQTVPLVDLEARGFSTLPWKRLPPQLVARVGKLEKAKSKMAYNVSDISLHPDVVTRGRFQKL